MLSFLRRRHPNPLVAAYQEATSEKIPPKTSIDELRFLVIDAEATGFKLGKDRLLSLAASEITKGQLHLARSWSWLIYQPSVALNEAVMVHGILPSETATGLPEAKVLEEFLPLLHGAVIVGHHIGFDAALLDQALQQHFQTRLLNPLLDTALMAMEELEAFRRTGYANQRPPGLDEVCAHLGIETFERHTAEGDTFTTAELFLHLCARLRRRVGQPLKARDLPLRKL